MLAVASEDVEKAKPCVIDKATLLARAKRKAEETAKAKKRKKAKSAAKARRKKRK